jgi:DNA-binding beta-propeller fold protein YncE
MQPMVFVYERDGSFVGTFGEGQFTERTHGLTIGPDDTIYTVDDGNHTVRKFTKDGELVLMLGTPGFASDTGYKPGDWVDKITHGGPPFNRPTDVAVAPNGDLYVADGYGNARVHRFAADGTFIQSWGEPGTAPGQFNLPHGVGVAPDGRVFVTDRENERIQIFTPTGEFLGMWTNVQRPTDISFGRDGLVYVSELGWLPGNRSFVHGPRNEKMVGRVSVLDMEGNVLARWGGEPEAEAGNFWAPHTICSDAKGDIYVGEVAYTFGGRGKAGIVPADAHTFQKFERLG